MTTMSSSLLEFILDLLSNDDELQKFEADSERYVMDAGFAGCAAEVSDGVKVMGAMRPTHDAAKSASTEHKDDGKDDGKDDHGGRHHSGKQDDHHDGHDGHHDGHHGGGDVHHVTNNFSTTNNNGDSYDIHADDEAQVALNGGINVGDDVEGDLDYEPEGSFNENGSGVQINGEDASIGGDLNSAGGSGSAVNTGDIDNSTSDDDVTVKIEDVDVNAVVGDNNDTQQQSDEAEMENEGLIVVDNPGFEDPFLN